jgi:HAD superfamily hydrolase (TIGR01549 family)
MKILGALFDMDGTVVDVPYDWPRIKADLGSGKIPILSYLNGLAEPERSRKWTSLRRYEDEATARAVPKRGIRGFLGFLEVRGIRTALITNNSDKNTNILLSRFHLGFDLVMTRESGLWKPSGAPLIAAMKKLGLAKNACCAIGDSHFDIRAAEEAGLPHIFILNRSSEAFRTSKTVEFFPSVAGLKERMTSLLEERRGRRPRL